MAVTISIYHDCRTVSKSGLYPVKIRVYRQSEEKYYQVLHANKKLAISVEDFQKVTTPTPKGKHKDWRISIDACIARAEDIVKGLNPFTFNRFKEQYTGKVVVKSDIVTYFNAIIAEKDKAGHIRTARLFSNALSSIKTYWKYLHGSEPSAINFEDITPQWLRDYQKYMLAEKKALTTVSIYTRNLRKVYNEAIDDKACHPDLYPFGKGKKSYKVPKGNKKKKNIDHTLIGKLFKMDLSHDAAAEKARAFWFFSYVCNGMNFKDIVHLKYGAFDNDTFSFTRKKSEETTEEQVVVVVPVTPYVKEVIAKYGNKDRSPDNYVFPVLEHGLTPKQCINKLNDFLKFVNEELRPIAIKLGLPEQFTTMYARHSFSTNVIRNGQSLEFVQKALGHTDMKTTMNYFAGFEDDTLHKVNSKLLDFD